MKKVIMISWILFSTLLAVSCAQNSLEKKYLSQQDDGLYGSITVAEKIIFFELFYEKAPLTVTNFVGLATGKFQDNISRKDNYFDGLIFHRVVQNFVIQGGDPDGTGRGGPGYSFSDEFHPELKHDGPGILSMANSGPNTNGSQFFITLAATPHLDNKHSVFGKVIEGTDVPAIVVQEDVIDSVKIYAKGKGAKQFLDEISWESFQTIQDDIAADNQKQETVKREAFLQILEKLNLTETPEGVHYKLEKKGTGRSVQSGDEVEVNYELSLLGNDEILDSSFARNETFTLTVGNNQVIRGWEIILQKLKVGDTARVVIPPELGYGQAGAGGGVIPPGAFLNFLIEVVAIKK